MPLLEVLPNSTTTSAPGWAYVPDIGLDPVKAGHVPQNPRKRTAKRTGLNSGQGAELSARQQLALQKRLADLDRDNARDVNIAIPSREKDREGGGGRAPKGKTPATRRILLAQKTFANYLADEEALAAQQGEGEPGLLAVAAAAPRSSPAPGLSPALSTLRSKSSGGAAANQKRKASGAASKRDTVGSSAAGSSPPPPASISFPSHPPPAPPTMTVPPPPQPPPAAAKSNAPPPSANPFALASEDTDMVDAPAEVPPPAYVPPPPPPLPPLSPRSERLLRTNTPSAPSEELLYALTHAAPLSYHAARAPAPGEAAGNGPLVLGRATEKRPPRRFCVMCGRWGVNRCTGCGEGICGLECGRGHGEGCVGAGGFGERR